MKKKDGKNTCKKGNTTKVVVWLRKGTLYVLATAVLASPTIVLAEGTIFDPTVPGNGGNYASNGMTSEEYYEWIYSQPDGRKNQVDTTPSSNPDEPASNKKPSSGRRKPKTSLDSLKNLNKGVEDSGEYIQLGMEEATHKGIMEKEWEQVEIGSENKGNTDVLFTGDNSYARYEEILHHLACNENVALYEVGKSEEGHRIYALEISGGQEVAADDRKYIIVAAGTNGEAAGALAALKATAQFINGNGDLNGFTLVVLPCANPDSFEAFLAREEPTELPSYPTQWAGFVKKGEVNKGIQGGNLGDDPAVHATMGLLMKYAGKTKLLLHITGYEQMVRAASSEHSQYAAALAESFNSGLGATAYSHGADTPVTGSFEDYAVQSVIKGYQFNPKAGRLSDMGAENKPINESLVILSCGFGDREYTNENRAKWAKDFWADNWDKQIASLIHIATLY